MDALFKGQKNDRTWYTFVSFSCKKNTWNVETLLLDYTTKILYVI